MKFDKSRYRLLETGEWPEPTDKAWDIVEKTFKVYSIDVPTQPHERGHDPAVIRHLVPLSKKPLLPIPSGFRRLMVNELIRETDIFLSYIQHAWIYVLPREMCIGQPYTSDLQPVARLIDDPSNVPFSRLLIGGWFLVPDQDPLGIIRVKHSARTYCWQGIKNGCTFYIGDPDHIVIPITAGAIPPTDLI